MARACDYPVGESEFGGELPGEGDPGGIEAVSPGSRGTAEQIPTPRVHSEIGRPRRGRSRGCLRSALARSVLAMTARLCCEQEKLAVAPS